MIMIIGCGLQEFKLFRRLFCFCALEYESSFVLNAFIWYFLSIILQWETYMKGRTLSACICLSQLPPSNSKMKKLKRSKKDVLVDKARHELVAFRELRHVWTKHHISSLLVCSPRFQRCNETCLKYLLGKVWYPCDIVLLTSTYDQFFHFCIFILMNFSIVYIIVDGHSFLFTLCKLDDYYLLKFR